MPGTVSAPGILSLRTKEYSTPCIVYNASPSLRFIKSAQKDADITVYVSSQLPELGSNQRPFG